MKVCKVCGNASGNKNHVAREMMFGLRDRFNYLECGSCGCLQLLDIPADLGKYYPRNYYSYQQHGWLKTAIRQRWSAHNLGRRSLLGWLISRFVMVNTAMRAVRQVGVSPQDRILDVGCGSGRLLLDLKHLGFTKVTGVDPYLEHDIVYAGGPTVFKKQLSEMEGSFDLIMLHHSFEHMDHPAEVMKDIARLLAPEGRVIVRIPVASSYAWKHYGVNWVHLDAPRHLYLHTSESIRHLASLAGLTVTRAIHESDEGTFWASEAYARDIPMYDPRSPVSSPLKKLLSPGLSRQYRAQAAEINRREEADMLCFVLARTATDAEPESKP